MTVPDALYPFADERSRLIAEKMIEAKRQGFLTACTGCGCGTVDGKGEHADWCYWQNGGRWPDE